MSCQEKQQFQLAFGNPIIIRLNLPIRADDSESSAETRVLSGEGFNP